MKRRRLRRLLLLAVIVSLMVANSVLGTSTPSWLQCSTLGLAALLSTTWVLS